MIDDASTHTYEDDFISFEYPKHVAIEYAAPAGGRADSQTLAFMKYDQESGSEALMSISLDLSYLVNFAEGNEDSYESVEALKAYYEQFDMEIRDYEVDGRPGVMVVTEDMTGETFFLVIPAETEGDAYRFNGAYLNETTEMIIDTFVKTAELKK